MWNGPPVPLHEPTLIDCAKQLEALAKERDGHARDVLTLAASQIRLRAKDANLLAGDVEEERAALLEFLRRPFGRYVIDVVTRAHQERIDLATLKGSVEQLVSWFRDAVANGDHVKRYRLKNIPSDE